MVIPGLGGAVGEGAWKRGLPFAVRLKGRMAL